MIAEQPFAAAILLLPSCLTTSASLAKTGVHVNCLTDDKCHILRESRGISLSRAHPPAFTILPVTLRPDSDTAPRSHASHRHGGEFAAGFRLERAL